VTVIDFGQAESGEPYLVMEYLEGEDLDHRLRRVGRLPIETTVHVIRQVASALNAAHDQGVVHRDLKPGNVFLVQVPGEPDFVKVLDFGISKMKAARTQLTSASTVMGTPNYMSPEQATGMIDDIDHRADQWALGCITWEMLLGRCPFVADETAALLYQIINLDPHPLAPRVPGLPPAVETALRRALRKKPAERFSSMREFARELEAAAFGRPADATPAPVMVSSFAPPVGPTIGYSATQVPLPPVRIQPAGPSSRDARKVEVGVSQTSVSSVHAIVASLKDRMRSAMAQVGRIKPIYAIVAAAGVLLLLGAFLLLHLSHPPKPTATSAAQPVVTPLPQPPAPPVVAPEPTAATTAEPAHRSARPKHQKSVDPFAVGPSTKSNPFTDGGTNKPAQTTTPRRKAKKKLFEEL
jgi:serine/threonine-protein kinase